MMKHTPEDGFPYYLELAGTADLRSLLSSKSTFEFLSAISEEKAQYRYAPGKWSVKQVVGHITDHERIMMFRAFSLSRNEPIELWGYDQNHLVAHSRFEDLTLQELVTDFQNVRNASISFLDSLSEKQLNIVGKARKYEVRLEDFLKSIIGHERHHLNVIRNKYMTE